MMRNKLNQLNLNRVKKVFNEIENCFFILSKDRVPNVKKEIKELRLKAQNLKRCVEKQTESNVTEEHLLETERAAESAKEIAVASNKLNPSSKNCILDAHRQISNLKENWRDPGSTKDNFMRSKEGSTHSKSRSRIILEVDQLSELTKNLEKSDVEIIEKFQRTPDSGAYTNIADPDGNIIGLYESGFDWAAISTSQEAKARSEISTQAQDQREKLNELDGFPHAVQDNPNHQN